MKVFVVNAGSSSLKFQLIDMDDETIIAKGVCERVGIGGSFVKYSRHDEAARTSEAAMPDHKAAMVEVMRLLTTGETAVIGSTDEIGAVGHRVVHGGERFSGAVRIDKDVVEAIVDCVELAILHNPPNLIGIDACMAIMPNVPHVAVFDTAFHQTMPKHAFLYAIPYDLYGRHSIRKYGFHGTSHMYVAQKAADMLGRDPKELKVITCHLGNGSSVCAVDGGVSVDTTMGLTPLDGVIMGTRSGSVDPALVEALMEKESMDIKETMSMLNKRSGVLGISGISSDFRDLYEAEAGGDERAALAIRMFTYSVTKAVGAFAAAMGGVDAIVFTAGIGENNQLARKAIVSGLGFMGAVMDDDRNAMPGSARVVSADGSRVAVLVIPTNEELVIARETLALT